MPKSRRNRAKVGESRRKSQKVGKVGEIGGLGISKVAKFIFFADDANIVITGSNFVEIQHQADMLLAALDKWVKTTA